MLGPLDYALWIASGLAQGGSVVCLIMAGSFRRYFPLSLCMLATFFFTVSRYLIFEHYGIDSSQYWFFYYYSEALLTICLYCALMALYSDVFQEMGASRYVRIAAVLLLGLTALFSYQVVNEARDQMFSRFVVKLGQNMNFLGVVLTYMLWAAVLKLRETRTRLIQLVLALGIYFSVFAANFALRNLYPSLSVVWQYLPPIMALWLPLAGGYTFLKIPEEARLTTARVAAPNR